MSRSRTTVGALGAALLALAVTACGGTAESSAQTDTEPPAAAEQFPLTITDASGQELTFDEPPSAIGCFWAGCDETLASLGQVPHASPNVNENTEGELIYPNGLPEQDPNDLGGYDNPESWAAAGVDLIVTRGPATPEAAAFEQAAPILYLYAPGLDGGDTDLSGLEAYQKNVELMGQITGRTAEADAALAQFGTFMDDLASVAPPGAADTTVAGIFQSDDGTYYLVPEDSPFCAALADYDLGSCVPSSAADAETAQINAEAFLALDPDWIAYIGGEDGTEFSYTERVDAVWSQLRAVSEDQVYNAASRVFCCSLRTLAPVLQEYAFHAWGPDSGVADAGDVLEYTYTEDASPLTEG